MRLLDIARFAGGKKSRRQVEALSPCKHISYQVSVSYPTSFQVSFFDENGMPAIRECSGKRFEKEMVVAYGFGKILIKVFVWNPAQLKDQTLHITIHVNGALAGEKIFPVSHIKTYDGWFNLDLNQL